MKSWRPSAEETAAVVEAVEAARQVQTFLWGEANGEWGLEEWLRMFRKRVAKLEEVRCDNPHASVELRKRLLQSAALSVALMGIIDRDGVPWEASGDAPPSNFPQYDSPVGGEGRELTHHMFADGGGCSPVDGELAKRQEDVRSVESASEGSTLIGETVVRPTETTSGSLSLHRVEGSTGPWVWVLAVLDGKGGWVGGITLTTDGLRKFRDLVSGAIVKEQGRG